METDKSTQNLKAAILEAALPDIAFDGFTEQVIERAAKTAGVDPAEARLAFPGGGVDLAVCFVFAGTGDMQAKLSDIDMEGLKIRERITLAVRTRLEVDEARKEAARRAFNLLALPVNAADAARCLAHTVNAMWRSVGDESTDFNYYSKRAILAAVYGSTRLFWLNDESKHHEESWSFLDRRIENVMQIEKGKAKLKAFKEKLGDPLETLARFRYR